MGHMTLGEAFVSGIIIGAGAVALIAAIVYDILYRKQRLHENVLRTWSEGDRTLALIEVDAT